MTTTNTEQIRQTFLGAECFLVRRAANVRDRHIVHVQKGKLLDVSPGGHVFLWLPSHVGSPRKIKVSPRDPSAEGR